MIWDGDSLLMTQRPPGGALGLQWEFPGGKIEPGESPEEAMVREVREELGVTSTAGETLGTARHDYAHGTRVEITFVRCEIASRDLRPSPEVHAMKWVSPAEVRLEEVLEADRPFLMKLGAVAERAGDP